MANSTDALMTPIICSKKSCQGNFASTISNVEVEFASNHQMVWKVEAHARVSPLTKLALRTRIATLAYFVTPKAKPAFPLRMRVSPAPNKANAKILSHVL